MMELTALQQKMPAVCELRYNEPLHLHTSFRIGGNAEIMAFPKTADELSAILKASNLLDTTPYILGAGTNVLAPDAGIDGIVICLKDCLDGMEQLDDHRIRIMAGVTMTRAAVFAANLGLSGLEFAHGIPGTVGGGVYMNAGAYSGEISQVFESAQIMDRNGEIYTRNREEMDFSYRHSILENSSDILISATFALEPKPVEQIRSQMKDLMAKRSASQPLDLPSAGSAFKRPCNAYAAALIDQAGLKGLSVGGAAVSEKHAGFIVNTGGATASDVQELLRIVAERVYSMSGIRLEPEVRIW